MNKMLGELVGLKKTYQPAAVNIIWAVVAVVAILQIAF